MKKKLSIYISIFLFLVGCGTPPKKRARIIDSDHRISKESLRDVFNSMNDGGKSYFIYGGSHISKKFIILQYNPKILQTIRLLKNNLKMYVKG